MGLLDKLTKRRRNKNSSWIRNIISGSIYRVSDIKIESSYQDIKTQIECARSLAKDSQVSTALNFYATDSTLRNTEGNIIWASAKDDKFEEAAQVINSCFKKWKINRYVRDHILELATVGNLYIPTTRLYADNGSGLARKQIGLETNTIQDENFDIIPSYKLQPEEVVHLWKQGKPEGFIWQPDDEFKNKAQILMYPEEAILHFSLGGLLGEYTLDALDPDGKEIQYDIQFAQPLMERAFQPTQTLSLLEDSVLLSSLIRVVKFINVDVGTSTEEDEIRQTLEDIKQAIETQLSLDTSTGDIQSFVNPQSPNNLIYLPKVGGQDAVSITDLNMAEATEQDSKLLDYFQNKKLSVLGVPKEAMNYSSNEGLGGAGSVLSQRSQLYADSLQRIETAYIEGWVDGFNKYFTAKGFPGYVDNFTLHMQPIITQQSTIASEKRDAALSQASAIVDLMTNLGVDNANNYRNVLVEILSESLPSTGAEVPSWSLNPTVGGENDEF